MEGNDTLIKEILKFSNKNYTNYPKDKPTNLLKWCKEAI